MSWIAGWISENLPQDAGRVLSSVHGDPLFTVSDPRLCILAGGLSRTMPHGSFSGRGGSPHEGWLVCGLGIRKTGDHCSLLSAPDWETLLRPPVAPDFRTIDGHFIACRWSEGKVEVFSDQLGLRTLYAGEGDGGVFFSTRIDSIARLVKGAAIDFRELGPRWLSFNQFSFASGLHGIRRLGPGGHGVLTARGTELHCQPWRPAQTGSGNEPEILSHLRALTNPVLQSGERISLGLSGGLDSRTLLAVLLNRKAAFDVHIFGSDADPDVRTAIRIAHGENLNAVIYDDPVPAMDDCIRLMQEFAAQAYLCEPVTSSVRLGYYRRMQARNSLMIDGGFGEFLRRQFLNRLLYRGRSALEKLDPAAISRFLSVDRGRIFTEETRKIMEEGVTLQLRDALEMMPPIGQVGAGNFLDIFTIRHRVPNYGGPEQARLDGAVLNYMPYAQPSLLSLAFSVPASQRANGRIFRRLIDEVRPSLSRYPLAKAGSTYPFRLTTLEAWMWTKMKSHLGRPYRDTLREQVLEKVRPFVMDILDSVDVKTFGAYDRGYVSGVVRGYYAGSHHDAAVVDWWLTFELWRRSLGRR